MYNLSPEGLERKRKSTVEALGHKVNLLDYDTGEIIDTYKTIREAAVDNYVDRTVLSKALRDANGIIKSRQLRFQKVSK